MCTSGIFQYSNSFLANFATADDPQQCAGSGIPFRRGQTILGFSKNGATGLSQTAILFGIQFCMQYANFAQISTQRNFDKYFENHEFFKTYLVICCGNFTIIYKPNLVFGVDLPSNQFVG